MVMRLLTHNPPTTRNPPIIVEREQLEAQLERELEGSWSTRTWAQYRSLWTRFSLFTQANNLTPDGHAAAMFVTALPVTVQSKHTYVRDFITIFRKSKMDHTELTMLDSSLCARGALIPTTQAPPMTIDAVRNLYRILGYPERYLIMLAWKTASRWDEIQRLQASSFLLLTPTEIVIYFGNETKTSRIRPNRADLFVVIRGAYTAELCAFFAPHVRNRKVGPLFPYPVQKITDILRRWGFTAHSMKRGATTHIMLTLPEGSPHLQLLPLLEKHAPHFATVQDVDLRYCSEKQIAIARHLGTGILTSLL